VRAVSAVSSRRRATLGAAPVFRKWNKRPNQLIIVGGAWQATQNVLRLAALPGAIGRMAVFGIGPLIATTVGIILLGLLRTPLRWSGAAVMALSVIWALAMPQPDVLISGDGHNVGVRGKDGRLHLMRTAKDAFLLKECI
jgi:hypothetical protein